MVSRTPFILSGVDFVRFWYCCIESKSVRFPYQKYSSQTKADMG